MRYLGLDLGDRRIGVAISDQVGMIARPLEVFERTSRDNDFRHLQALVEAHQVDALVAGLPVNMDGTEGPQAAWVHDYSRDMAERLCLPLTLWDERLSTEEAKEIMRAQGKAPDKGWIDAVAAAVILQGFLDAQS